MHGLPQYRQDRAIRHSMHRMAQYRPGSQDMGIFQDGIQGGLQGIAPHRRHRIYGIPWSRKHSRSIHRVWNRHMSATLVNHDVVTPSASLATSATNVSVMMPTTSRTMPHQHRYNWTHGTIINMCHNSATCREKGKGHQDYATEVNKLGGSTNVCGGQRT
jgi:hypothetical protein